MENIDYYSVIDHPAYVFYRENSKVCNRELVAHFVEYGKLISTFYDIVAENITESKSGVFLKNLGYFGVLVNPLVPKFTKYNFSDAPGIRTKDYMFLTFVPIASYKMLNYYTMDLGFVHRIRKELTEKLKKGWHYDFTPSLFFKKTRTLI